MSIPTEQFRGDHYSCDGCDYYYETKNIRGMSHTCPKCKGTSVTNLSFEERKEEYKKYLLRKKEEARLIKKQKIADKKLERKWRAWKKRKAKEMLKELKSNLGTKIILLIGLIVYLYWKYMSKGN